MSNKTVDELIDKIAKLTREYTADVDPQLAPHMANAALFASLSDITRQFIRNTPVGTPPYHGAVMLVRLSQQIGVDFKTATKLFAEYERLTAAPTAEQRAKMH
jgi:hypothetical protein